MSDPLKHECGIALIRLLKPLTYYQEKYQDKFYGLSKMYLLLQKQHNRGQDGAGVAVLKTNPAIGEKYIFRERSNQNQPIQDVFKKINQQIELHKKENLYCGIPFYGELLMGHLRYGTFGGHDIEQVHPFIRENNWMHRNLIVSGNFNLTNTQQLIDSLVELGQHPRAIADTITIMEKIGHFLDKEVSRLYKNLKKDGISKKEASPIISEQLDIKKILLDSSKWWDGGYVMGGIIGHGDLFTLRDPHGIRPAYYYTDDEIVIIASERPAIQTVFNVPFQSIKELDPGHFIAVKKSGRIIIDQLRENTPLKKKRTCSFERIYFSRGNDAEIYQERKQLGRALFPRLIPFFENKLENTVFSFIPNTSETSFLGLVDEANSYLNELKTKEILSHNGKASTEIIQKTLSKKIRMEKIAIKDVKLRTFITQDESRNDLVSHVYDVTYGIVKENDTLVVIDDSIVRGTTLKQSILKMLYRLNPREVIIVSSAPQIRYPDCYGIDMARLDNLIAFQAATSLLKEMGQEDVLKEIYQQCQKELKKTGEDEITNPVKKIYEPFSEEQISKKIADLLIDKSKKTKVSIVYQSIEELHKACPNNLGDWYFTGNFPTKGGKHFVNQAYINYFEGSKSRGY